MSVKRTLSNIFVFLVLVAILRKSFSVRRVLLSTGSKRSMGDQNLRCRAKEADIIISRCSEQINWLASFSCCSGYTFYLYEKCELSYPKELVHLRGCTFHHQLKESRGKVAFTYLYHITEHYENISTYSIFLKAKTSAEQFLYEFPNKIMISLEII